MNKKRRAASASVVVEIPAAIDTENFRTAWAAWRAYKVACRKPVPEASQRAQMKKLATWGETAAVRAIENSIANTWQGLFEPKEDTNGKRFVRNAGPAVRHPDDDRSKLGVF